MKSFKRHCIFMCGLIGAVFLSTKAFAQAINDTTKTVNINEVVISASKFEDTRMRVSQQVALIPSSEIRLQNPQTTADLLQNSGALFVQKREMCPPRLHDVVESRQRFDRDASFVRSWSHAKNGSMSSTSAMR